MVYGLDILPREFGHAELPGRTGLIGIPEGVHDRVGDSRGPSLVLDVGELVVHVEEDHELAGGHRLLCGISTVRLGAHRDSDDEEAGYPCSCT